MAARRHRGARRPRPRRSTGVVAVDTGSKDEQRRPPARRVRRGGHASPAATSYPDAVRLGLEQVARRGRASGSGCSTTTPTPRPTRSRALLAAAAADPAGRRARPQAARVALAQAPARGRRHDLRHRPARDRPRAPASTTRASTTRSRQVLAVNTAGMLVRRAVLERARRPRRPAADVRQRHRLRLAGGRAPAYRTVVVPQAVVFHAEAAHRGLRRTPLTGRHTHYQERRAALFTLLANAPAARLPWQVVRLFFGTLLRMIGFLRRPLGRRGARRAGRAGLGLRQPRRDPPRPARARTDVRRPHDPRRCSRRGGCPTGTASTSSATSRPPSTNQAQDVADRRRAAPRRPTAPGAASAAPVVVRRRRGRLARTPGWSPASSPTRWPSRSTPGRGAVGLSAPARRSAASPAAAWPRRPAAPATCGGCGLESWHALGTGHRRPGAGVRRCRWRSLGSVLGGSAAAAVSAVLLLAVPLGAVGCLAAAPRGRPTRRPGRLAALAGRSGRGHLRPGAGHVRRLGRRPARRRGRGGAAARGSRTPPSASPTPSPTVAGAPPGAPGCCWPWPRRSSRSRGSSPSCWPLVVLVGGYAVTRSLPRDRTVWGPPAVALGVVPVLLAPVVAARPLARRRLACC